MRTGRGVRGEAYGVSTRTGVRRGHHGAPGQLVVNNIPEQFTVKAHPAIFDREGVSRKMRHCYSSLQLTYTFKTRTKHKKLRRLALCVY